jgi:hypothetical protein
MTTPVALTATEVASSAHATSSTKSTTAIAPGAPATHHTATNVTAIFQRRAMSNNLLKMVWSCKRLVHAKILVLIIAVLEATALVLHGAIVGGYVDMALGSSGDRLLDLWFAVVVLPGSLLGLLLALVLGFLLVVGELDFVGLLVVEVGGIGVLLCAQWLGEDKGGVVVDVVDGRVLCDT